MWGEKINYYRKKRGLTQSDLAQGICSVSYLSKVEHNSIEPSQTIIIPICERLNIQFDDHQTLDELNEQLTSFYSDIVDKNMDAAQEKYRSIQTQMKWIEEPNTIAWFHLLSARFQMSQKDLVSAKESLLLVEKMVDQLKDDRNYYYNSFLGLYHYLDGAFYEALKYYRLANDLRKEYNIQEPNFIYQLAIVYGRTNQNSKAISAAHEALSLFNQNSSYSKSVDCLILLGINYNRIGNREEAKVYLNQAIKASKDLVNKNTFLIPIYHNLGYVYSIEGISLEAITYYEKSLNLNDNKFNVQTIYLLAKEYYLINQLQNAKEQVEKAKKYIDVENTTYKLKLSILSLKIDHQEKTVEYEHLLIQALNYFTEKNDIVNLHDIYIEIGDYYSSKFTYKKSSEYYRKALDLNYKYMK